MIKAKRLLEINDKGQGKAIGINITVGKKWCCIAHEKCDCWRMQDWKKKKQSSKALEENASLEKKKTKFKSVGECKSGKKIEKKW